MMGAVIMSKAKLLFGAAITVCALGVTTGMVSAAVKHVPEKAKPAPVASLDSGPPASLHCKKGQTFVLHTMGNKMSWACMKAA
jgi:hypothetical protein